MSKGKLVRLICPACDGFGGPRHSSHLTWSRDLGAHDPAPRCPRCHDTGIISAPSLPSECARSIQHAALCPVCGVRSFGDRCNAPLSFHQAHQRFTDLVSAGGVFLRASLLNPYRRHLKGRSVRYWSPSGSEWTETGAFYSTTPEGWLLLGQDDAEDLGQVVAEENNRDVLFFTHALRITEGVKQGLSLWHATLLVQVTQEDHKALLVNGYMQEEYDSAACPMWPPKHPRGRVFPAWLLTAWAHHWTTRYPKKQFGPDPNRLAEWELPCMPTNLPRNRAERRKVR